MALSAYTISRGQAVLMDFTFGAMLFVIAWFFLSANFDAKLAYDQKQLGNSIMQVRADFALESVVKGPGIPSNWENRSFSDLNSVGIAYKDRFISESKLAAFSNFSGADYSGMKSKLGLYEYDFYFTFDGIDDANAGLEAQGSATKISVKRIVTYKGEPATATLEVYRLE